MPNAKDLPHLLQLLDDDSPSVREELSRQLSAYGEDLKTELARLNLPPDSAQRRLLQEMMREPSRRWLREAWLAWVKGPESLGSLEEAMALLSEYQTGYVHPVDLGILLDSLAAEYRLGHKLADPPSLAAFLFKDKGLQGNQNDYFDPRNSSLVHVLRERRGIPISLSLVYMLVGARLGLSISGCHFPGHFLARVEDAGRDYLVDCFNGGCEVDHKVLASSSEQTPWGVQGAIEEAASPHSIVARVLRNLAKAFEEAKRPDDVALMAELGLMLEREALKLEGTEALASLASLGAQPLYATGAVLRSKRWGFKAVVVDFDLSCKAPESWRRRRGAEASAKQPWYHLFVDGTDQVSYAPEDSLAMDAGPTPVKHPLLEHFFERFERGKHWRNHRPWPGTNS